MKKLIVMAILMLTTIGCQGKENKVSVEKSTVGSGKIINGLRTYSENDVTSGNLTAFRGDYVVIDVKSGSKTITIDSLKINHTFPADTTGKKYFKLKKVGKFNYSFAGKQGVITVDEFTQPNYKLVSAKEGFEIIKNLSPLVLDVRTPGEYERGHLKDAKLIPVGSLESDYTQIADYKDRPIFIYCASGNRSTVASRILLSKGFKNIYNLSTGIGGWYNEGLEIVK